uniref:Uncharacterized protein n=1 Tax=Eutreptiella gymnastica TaxID=73025 RepID=A0A7S4FUY8_9EUGL
MHCPFNGMLRFNQWTEAGSVCMWLGLPTVLCYVIFSLRRAPTGRAATCLGVTTKRCQFKRKMEFANGPWMGQPPVSAGEVPTAGGEPPPAVPVSALLCVLHWFLRLSWGSTLTPWA